MMQPSTAFSIKAVPDLSSLQRQFAETGVVQIPAFIEREEAAALRDHTLAREDWHVALLAGGETPLNIGRRAWAAMTAAQREALTDMAAPTERHAFRFLFEELMIVGDDFQNVQSGNLLGAFGDFMGSSGVLDFARAVTGLPDISGADARATLYGPGHFLCEHNDRREDLGRRAAYVFGLTDQWRTEWGGLLLFHGADGNITAGKVPALNVLTLFRVPQSHSVSVVAPFAPRPRCSVSGWLRAETV